MLNYYLTPNTVPEDASGYHAVVTQSEGEDVKHFVLTLAHLLNVNEGEARRVIAGISEAAKDLLSQGWGFKIDGIGTFSLGITGGFPSPEAPFNHAVNKVGVRFQADKEITAAARSAKMTRLHGIEHGPVIDAVEDKDGGVLNGRLSPGKGALLSGRGLKIAGEDPACGVWLIDEAGGETQVSSGDILENHPTRLLFICPPLPAGSYHLRVTTQSSNSSRTVGIPRSYIFPAPLVVSA
jgi:hypothetical protein